MAVTQTTGSGGASAFFQSSASNSALQGEVGNSTNTSIKIPFGILGEYDPSGKTFGVGVVGISATGYAVAAEAFGGSPAVLALGEGSSYGVEAGSVGTLPALYAEATGNAPGAEIVSDKSNGLVALSTTNDTSAVVGDEEASTIGTGVLGSDSSSEGAGVTGISTSGEGVVAESDSGKSSAPALAGSTTAKGTDLIQGDVLTVVGSTLLPITSFSVGSSSANASGSVITSSGATGDVQANGDLYLSGKVYTGCTSLFPASSSNCQNTGGLASVSRSSNGTMLTTYSSQHASATMEDEGEAQLVNGTAHVALDPAFASTIATAQPYLVFTTPRGDNRGLYVTHVTPSGFDVRESSNGRSTLAFDYRIVAHPYGDRSQRLAVVHPATRAAISRPAAASGLSTLLRTVKADAKARFVKPAAPKSFVSLNPR